MSVNSKQDAPILTVTELNQFARGCLEMHVGKIWVSGEVSNFSQPASGHWYFTLKDSKSQIRCAMFRNRQRLLRTKIQNGMQILLQGQVSLYEARGDYQLIADYLEEAGIGSMQRAFEQLRNKLQAEGLFASSSKKPLPQNHQHIAVITSRTGAAIHDIINVARTRQPNLKITLVNAQVQGEKAASSLLSALQKVQRQHQQTPFDALIIGRGGGSLEDLWAFNDETLARALKTCPIPTISAVGHEVDFSICDYVCDVRAATPSQAAELVSQEQQQQSQQLDNIEQNLLSKLNNLMHSKQQLLQIVQKSLQHPGQKLTQLQMAFTHQEQALKQTINSVLRDKQYDLTLEQNSLHSDVLQLRIQHAQENMHTQQEKLSIALKENFKQKQLAFSNVAAKLDLVSPLATLERGYSITENKQGIIRKSKSVSAGETITTRLSDGIITSTITEIS